VWIEVQVPKNRLPKPIILGTNGFATLGFGVFDTVTGKSLLERPTKAGPLAKSHSSLIPEGSHSSYERGRVCSGGAAKSSQRTSQSEHMIRVIGISTMHQRTPVAASSPRTSAGNRGNCLQVSQPPRVIPVNIFRKSRNCEKNSNLPSQIRVESRVGSQLSVPQSCENGLPVAGKKSFAMSQVYISPYAGFEPFTLSIRPINYRSFEGPEPPPRARIT